jgi:hypothetical protein
MLEVFINLAIVSSVIVLQVFLAVAQAVVQSADCHGDREADANNGQNPRESSSWYYKLLNYCHPRDRRGNRRPRRSLVIALIAATPLATLGLWGISQYRDACRSAAERIVAKELRDTENMKHEAEREEDRKRHSDVILGMGEGNSTAIKMMKTLQDSNTSLEAQVKGASQTIADLKKENNEAKEENRKQNADFKTQLAALDVTVKTNKPQVVVVPQPIPAPVAAPRIDVPDPVREPQPAARSGGKVSYRFEAALNVAPVPNQTVNRFLIVGAGNEGVFVSCPADCHWEPEAIRNGWAIVPDNNASGSGRGVSVGWPADVNSAYTFRGKGAAKLKFEGSDSTAHLADDSSAPIKVGFPARSK